VFIVTTLLKLSSWIKPDLSVTIEIFEYVVEFQTILFALGGILALIKIKLRSFVIKLVGVALLVSVFCNSLAAFLIYQKLNFYLNYVGSTAYSIFIFPLLTTLYFHLIKFKHKTLLIILVVFFELFALINAIFIQTHQLNTYTLIILSLIVTFYALYYFYELLRLPPESELQRLPMFWINTGYFIYYAGNFILFVFTSYLVNVLNNNLLVYWTFHNVLAIIETLLIITGIWMDLRNIKSPS
jgi:hypothetical protein